MAPIVLFFFSHSSKKVFLPKHFLSKVFKFQLSFVLTHFPHLSGCFLLLIWLFCLCLFVFNYLFVGLFVCCLFVCCLFVCLFVCCLFDCVCVYFFVFVCLFVCTSVWGRRGLGKKRSLVPHTNINFTTSKPNFCRNTALLEENIYWVKGLFKLLDVLPAWAIPRIMFSKCYKSIFSTVVVNIVK